MLLFVLAGCAPLGPDHVAPTATLPGEWRRAEGTAGITRDDAASSLATWWTGLGDPLLAALVAEGLAANPDLERARERLREVRAARRIAAAPLYPTLDATGNARRSDPSEEIGPGEAFDAYAAGFDARWELDVFGGTRRAIEAAAADIGQAGALLAATQVSLAAEIATTYVEFRNRQALLEVVRANLATQSETLQLTEWRALAGLVTQQDVAQARANREQTRAQLPLLQVQLAAAGHRLAVLLGQAPGALDSRLAAPRALPALPASLAVGIPAATLHQRPDVIAAERALAAATARVGVAEAQRYPAFTLSGSLGLEALELGALGGGSALGSTALAGVTAPLFNAGRLRAQVEAQDARRGQAHAEWRRTLLDALAEVENALVEYARTRERGLALGAAVDAAREAASLARQRYGAGLIDFQAVLTSERTALTLEESAAANRAATVQALIQLYKALGGGWSSDTVAARGGEENS